jgi:tetratricopeptide (TPR) repeat protein
LNRGWIAEHVIQASAFFERAMAQDPGNVEAIVGAALANYVRGGHLLDDRTARLAAAEAVLTKALSIAPEHALAHWCLGRVHTFTNRPAQGITECERALALDRNLAGAHASIGHAKMYIGRAEDTEAHIKEAFRLSPRDTFIYVWLTIAGIAKLILGKDEEAVGLFRRAVEANRNYPWTHLYLASALAHLGRDNDAQAATQAGLALSPSLTMSRIRAVVTSDNATYLSQRERAYDGMRKAGVPEE